MKQRRFNNGRSRPMSALSEIHVTPLLDMCFCLLIIFMIATPVLEQTTQIDLPVASKAVASTPAETHISPKVISLDRNGQLVFEGRATHEDELAAALRTLAEKPEAQQPIIKIRADGSLPNQRVWDIFSLARKSGIKKVSVDTEVND